MESCSVFLYVPNLVGYLRLALLLGAVMCKNNAKFLALYGASYILDALDGHLARALSQASSLGYILDMATDRASSTALILRIVSQSTSHSLTVFLSLVSVLDILSHFFCVSASAISKKTHKEHSGGGALSAVLRLYYSRTVLFLVCLLTEVFVACILLKAASPKKESARRIFCTNALLCISFPFFLFKQVTNVAQMIEAARGLSRAK